MKFKPFTSPRGIARLIGGVLCSTGVLSVAAEPPSVFPGGTSMNTIFAPTRALGERRLADQRAMGANTSVNIDGTLQQNTAVNVQTGSNVIREGSFANALGLTTVIQNTGANVLIQNATTVNVQFK